MKILILEDEPVIAEDIAQILEKNEYTISSICYTKDEAIHELENNTPEMALLDIHLSKQYDGIDIANLIHEKYHIPFIFVTSYSDKQTLEKAKHTEPSSYIIKPFNEANICSAIEIAFFNFTQRNKSQHPMLVLSKLNQRLQDTISEREFELLSLIYEGKTNKQLADALFISLNTVKKHINHIYLKIDASSRASAIVRLRELMT